MDANKNVAPMIFSIGGDMPVWRIGFGAMRITGPGIWGWPTDRKEAILMLRSLADAGINFVDTADSYGPNISELLIREALYPYDGMIVATKGGLTRTGPDQWSSLGRPEYLIQQAYSSLQKLGVERIDLWQLHRIDPNTPRSEQFDAVRFLQQKGVIRHAGLSEVSVEDIEEASKYFKVSTVQNRYNVSERSSEDVLNYCTENGIGFIAWSPLGDGTLNSSASTLDLIGAAHGATPGQIALAWLLQRSPVIIPIPGTSKLMHMRQNACASNIGLSPSDIANLDSLAISVSK